MINYGSGSDSERSTSVPEICFLVCLQAMTHPALQIFGALSFMYKSFVTHTMVLFMRHSATHDGSSNRRRSFHMHFPPQEFRNTRKDFFVSACSKNCLFPEHRSNTPSSEDDFTVAGTAYGDALTLS